MQALWPPPTPGPLSPSSTLGTSEMEPKPAPAASTVSVRPPCPASLGPLQPFCSRPLQLVSHNVLLMSPGAETCPLSPIPHVILRSPCHARALATASRLCSSLRFSPFHVSPSTSVVLSVVPRPLAPASPGNLLGPWPE